MSPPLLPQANTRKLPYTRYGPIHRSTVPTQDAPEGLTDEAAWIRFWNEIGDACSKLDRFSNISSAFATLILIGMGASAVWYAITYGLLLSWVFLLVVAFAVHLLGLCRDYLFSGRLEELQSLCREHNLAPYQVEIHYEPQLRSSEDNLAPSLQVDAHYEHERPGGDPATTRDLPGCYVYFYQPCATLQEDLHDETSGMFSQNGYLQHDESSGMLSQNGYLRIEIAKAPSWYAPPLTSLMNYDYIPQGFENLAEDWTEFWSQIDTLASNLVTIIRKTNLINFASNILLLLLLMDKTDEMNELAGSLSVGLFGGLMVLQLYYLSYLQSCENDLARILKEFEETFERHGVAVEYRKHLEPSSFHWLGSGSNLHRYIYLFHVEATMVDTTDEALV